MKNIGAFLSSWQHVILILGSLAAAVCAAIFVPGARWAALGALIADVAQHPAEATAFVSLIAGALATLRMAWTRQPPNPSVLLVIVAGALAASGCGAQLTDSQHAALAIETQRCLVNEREIVDRPGTSEEQDRADLAAERARCDAARAMIVNGGTP